jgi:hypothetical protein
VENEHPVIVRVSESFRIDPSGATTKVVVVLWTLGKHGPFSFEVPESEFSGSGAKSEVEKRAAELREVLKP